MLYFSHLLRDAEMKELCESTQAGIESIDFSISENLDCLYRTIPAYEKRLDAMGCRELTIHGPFLDINPMAFDRYVLEITRRRYDEAYLAAKALGAKKIIYHTCYIPKVYMLIGWAERVIDFYNSFLEDKHGIQILMENVQDPEIDPILEVADRIQHPDFGLCLDVGHAHCYAEQEVSAWAKSLGSHIKHLHLHDNDGSKDAHQPLGRGNIPLKDVIACVRSNSPKVTFTIENCSLSDCMESYNWLVQNEIMK